jgi:PTH1 family peptidyl-tRNA hydrolase
MKLLVGLGNPGAKYARHRHNVGFLAADAIMARRGMAAPRKRFGGEAAEGTLGAEKVLVLKPLTFMNESGRAVAEAARFYRIGPGDTYVFHDELDLAPGKVRVKRGGGVAGHNGLRSVAGHVGPDFWRIRIGIGHPGAKHLVHSHVLGNFAKADREWLEPLIDAIAEHAGLLADGDAANFMNRIALAARGEAPSGPPLSQAGPKRAQSARPRPAKAKSAPSQRDLARAAAAPAPGKTRAETAAPPPAAPEPDAPTGGPLAAALKALFGARRRG